MSNIVHMINWLLEYHKYVHVGRVYDDIRMIMMKIQMDMRLPLVSDTGYNVQIQI